MKIESITAIPVVVPLTYAGHFKRARKTHAVRTIVQVTSSDGIVGIGETRGTDAAAIIRDRLGREFALPVSSHCIQLDSLRAFPAITGVVCEPHNPGGMVQVCSLCDQAHGLNRKLWFRACFELGVSWVAMCHMGVAFAPMDRPAQTLFNWIEDDLIEEDDYAMRDGVSGHRIGPDRGSCSMQRP
ncbi:MAG: hypothetical protein GY896_09535 [Gammaproteobacteria bacterium]|nr:hypothetical protein [Gammaproteobacteria bacterium]